METKRIECITSESESFTELVKKAKLGDKRSMENILGLFQDEIAQLSRFITLPHEETQQLLESELISIVLDKL